VTKPPRALLRAADAAGLPASAVERQDCRRLSLWLMRQPKPERDERPASLDDIAAEMKRLSEA